MSDNEERPSKIRKLSSSVAKDLSQQDKNIPSHEVANTTTVAESSINKASELTENDNDDDNSAGQPVAADITQDEDKEGQPMSKNGQKKLRKKQERLEGREAWKAEKRAREKQKKARKAAEWAAAKAANPDLVSSKPVKKPGQRPVQVPLTFVLDCDFDNLMTDKEINSLSCQLTRCYSENKKGSFRSQLVVSSFGGQLKQRFETSFSSNHLSWAGVKFDEEDFVSVAEKAHAIMYTPNGKSGKVAGALAKDFVAPDVSKEPAVSGEATNGSEKASSTIKYTPRDDDIIKAPSPTQPSIVYLSSDSPNNLDVLSPYTTYIIGGIVDKNRHKGLCYKRARERGIPTAKLPIGDYMNMQSRTVLATNHVIEIMVRWLELGDWGEAFLKVIPKRKEATLKVKGGVAGQEDQDIEEDAQEVDEEEQNVGEQEATATDSIIVS